MTLSRAVLLAGLLALVSGCPASTTQQGTDAAVTADAAGDAAADVGHDAAPLPDSGIDCSTIGCGAPPLCGQACDAPCGCCPCAEGSSDGAGHVCTGGCWAPSGPCTTDGDCGTGFSCCYPCGIPGCTNQCEPTCSPSDPGCVDGCLQRA